MILSNNSLGVKMAEEGIEDKKQEDQASKLRSMHQSVLINKASKNDGPLVARQIRIK